MKLLFSIFPMPKLVFYFIKMNEENEPKLQTNTIPSSSQNMYPLNKNLVKFIFITIYANIQCVYTFHKV